MSSSFRLLLPNFKPRDSKCALPICAHFRQLSHPPRPLPQSRFALSQATPPFPTYITQRHGRLTMPVICTTCTTSKRCIASKSRPGPARASAAPFESSPRLPALVRVDSAPGARRRRNRILTRCDADSDAWLEAAPRVAAASGRDTGPPPHPGARSSGSASRRKARGPGPERLDPPGSPPAAARRPARELRDPVRLGGRHQGDIRCQGDPPGPRDPPGPGDPLGPGDDS